MKKMLFLISACLISLSAMAFNPINASLSDFYKKNIVENSYTLNSPNDSVDLLYSLPSGMFMMSGDIIETYKAGTIFELLDEKFDKRSFAGRSTWLKVKVKSTGEKGWIKYSQDHMIIEN